jgi:hypothetical protein
MGDDSVTDGSFRRQTFFETGEAAKDGSLTAKVDGDSSLATGCRFPKEND